MLEAVGNNSSSTGLVSQAISATERVTQAIKQASARAGVDFAYMLNKASQESGLNPNAKAGSSTATGLYQFVEQTWLRMVKTYGEKYGLGAAASRITIGSDGVARVDGQQTKQAILNLRKDPQVSACMAAELTNENKSALQNEVGGNVGSTELYLAHFLGAGGACEFLSKMQSNPNASAASVLPKAAAANPSVFYDKNGQARSLAQVYDRFAQKFEGSSSATIQMADAGTELRFKLPDLSSVDDESGMVSSYTPSFMNKFQVGSDMSSPFAAMLIAQMDAENITSSDSDENQKKKTISSALGFMS